jgi:hypothetical protein
MRVGPFVLLLALAAHLVCSAEEKSVAEKSVAVELKLKYNNDIGCSYMGAWVAHINLLRRVSWFMDICRAEAASTDREFDAYRAAHPSLAPIYILTNNILCLL